MNRSFKSCAPRQAIWDLRRWLGAGLLGLCLMLLPSGARAQEGQSAPPARNASYEWDSAKRLLYANLNYRDIVDGEIKKKLSRGLPTTIVLSAAIYLSGAEMPVATTVQSCKITWHVWEEAYRIELTFPGSSRVRWTTTVEGVLRRCAEANRLLVATSEQVPVGRPLFLKAKVQVNPISPELLAKIKRWVSRPSATGTAAPGDALFGTFTGLFLQRIGDAERELKFNTVTRVPKIPQKERESS